jgi:hypothetical protein
VPQADRLYLWESQGDGPEGTGRFVDSSERLDGLAPAYTLAVATLDVEGDGDTDLYVAVDSLPNHLWINEGGRFVDVGWSAGVAVSSDGAAEAGMGVAVGDVDRNGRLDLAVTNFSGETTQLYLGSERGFDVGTHRYGLQRETRELLSWSAHFVDLDADGWLELFTTNGHVYPEADLSDTGTRYGQPAMLWRLGPGARAERVAPHGADSLLFPALGARGAAVGDFDLDGAVDLVLARIDGPAALGMNRTGDPGGPGGAGARLTVRLVDDSLADAIGARAVLAVADGAGGERLAVAEVRTAEGYQSASSPWLHFGLGAAQRFERIDVRWPSGQSETIPGGPAGRMITIREGHGITAEQAFR